MLRFSQEIVCSNIVIFSILASFSCLADSYQESQVLELSGTPQNANFWTAVNNYSKGRIYYLNKNSVKNSIITMHKSDGFWVNESTIEVPKSIQSIRISPEGNYITWSGQKFAISGGNRIYLKSTKEGRVASILFEDQAVQEFGNDLANFGYKLALSKSSIASLSQNAGTLKSAVHLYELSQPSRWDRAQSIELDFVVDGSSEKEAGLIITSNWLIVISAQMNKVKFYKKNALSWSLSQEIIVNDARVWVNGVATDDSLLLIGVHPSRGEGALYFKNSGNQWSLNSFLNPTTKERQASISSLALMKDKALIGVSCQTGINGESCQGAAFLMKKIDSGWETEQILRGDEKGVQTQFGISVAFTEDNEILVGARNRNSVQSIANLNSGAIFLFKNAKDHLGITKETSLTYDITNEIIDNNERSEVVLNNNSNIGDAELTTPKGPSKIWTYSKDDIPKFWLKWRVAPFASSYNIQIESPTRDNSACAPEGTAPVTALGGVQDIKNLDEKDFCAMGFCYYPVTRVPLMRCPPGEAYRHKWRVKPVNTQKEGNFTPWAEFWSE